jgi:L-amino acid N-acyltransferase YncA
LPVLEQPANYRQIVTLNDGTRAVLRALTAMDNGNLADLFARHSDVELEFFHSNVRDRTLVESWAAKPDYAKVFPLVAEVDGRLTGDAILRFQTGPERHIALVSIFIAKEFRRRGLGTAMLRTLIDLARKSELRQLQAEIPSSHVKPITAFKELGFEHYSTLPDHFMTPEGETHDMDVLILTLSRRHEEF